MEISRTTQFSQATASSGPAHLTERNRWLFVWFLLAGPIVFYLFSFWLVRPLSIGSSFSLSLAAPAFFFVSLALITVSRAHFLNALKAVSFEFTLLAGIVILSLLSLVNSSEPFRCLRIVFPCLLPIALFAHLVVLESVSKKWLLQVPRLLLISGLALSVAPFLLSFGLPPLKSYLFSTYRLWGFFENGVQHGIVLSVLVPLNVVEIVLAKRTSRKIAWSIALGLLAYTLFRAGAKTPLFISLGLSAVLYAALKIPTQSLLRNTLLLTCMLGMVLFLWIFGIEIAKKLNPVMGEKIESIAQGGLANYQSVRSRQELWKESIQEGSEHWLIGSGAGERVLGIAHSHNLILNYFRGTGLFGAAAITLLCLSILGRTARKGFQILLGLADPVDMRIFACFVAASVYVICSQMSDCFGPSTIGVLWCAYLPAVLLNRDRRSGRNRFRSRYTLKTTPA